jgi:hypothetical protein
MSIEWRAGGGGKGELDVWDLGMGVGNEIVTGMPV